MNLRGHQPKFFFYIQILGFAPLAPQQRGCTKARSLPHIAGETPAYPTLNSGESMIENPPILRDLGGYELIICTSATTSKDRSKMLFYYSYFT